DIQRIATGVRPEVGDVIAVDVTFADRQRRQALRKALGALTDGRGNVERQIECRLAPAVEAAAADCRSLARHRRKGPGRIMAAITAPGEPQGGSGVAAERQVIE